MKKELPIALAEKDIERVAKTFSRDDTFTVLYLLTKARRPLSLEDLSQNYGANPIELRDRLSLLSHVALIQRKGRTYIPTNKARLAVEFLEEHFKDTQLSAEVAVAPESAAVLVNTEMYTGFPITNNGTCLLVNLSFPAVTPTQMVSNREQPVISNREQPVTAETPAVNVDPTTKPNATRSQLYM